MANQMASPFMLLMKASGVDSPWHLMTIPSTPQRMALGTRHNGGDAAEG